MATKAAASKAAEPAKTDARLHAALAERDAALAQLAEVKAELEQLRLSAGKAEPVTPNYPLSSGIGPPPMRYVLVDQANEAVKTFLGPVHRAVKALADRRRTP